MKTAKQIALHMYYHASLPGRVVMNTMRARRGQAPVMVLFYHRVADDHPNPWTISTRNFERQVRWLRKRFDLVSLEEAQKRIKCGNHRPAVSITFDDGYADNCDFALPLLLAYQIPCTYFVTLDNILKGERFPHDDQPLAHNTADELRELSLAGIEIGGHTRTHPNLGKINDANQLHHEVVTANEELQDIINQPIRYFAFPFGLPANLNDTVFELAKATGLSGVCSAYGGYNFPGDDVFHLQRIHGDPEMVRVKNWLSVDPRKLSVPRYTYPDSDRSVVDILAGSGSKFPRLADLPATNLTPEFTSEASD